MDTVVGVLGWIVIGLVVWAVRANRKSSAQNRPATSPGPRPAVARDGSTRRESREPPDHTAGWLLGHGIAHGQTGFGGDPLPGGHLGTPENLAFWGSISEFGDDDGADD